VIKIGTGEQDILRTSTNNTQHIFGFRVSADDEIQAYIKIDGQKEITGDLVDRDDDIITQASVIRTNLITGLNSTSSIMVSPINEYIPV